MTTQTAFTPQEWNMLRTMPALVASGVAALRIAAMVGQDLLRREEEVLWDAV